MAQQPLSVWDSSNGTPSGKDHGVKVEQERGIIFYQQNCSMFRPPLFSRLLS